MVITKIIKAGSMTVKSHYANALWRNAWLSTYVYSERLAFLQALKEEFSNLRRKLKDLHFKWGYLLQVFHVPWMALIWPIILLSAKGIRENPVRSEIRQ